MDGLESNGAPADIAEIEQIVKEKMVWITHSLILCSVLSNLACSNSARFFLCCTCGLLLFENKKNLVEIETASLKRNVGSVLI